MKHWGRLDNSDFTTFMSSDEDSEESVLQGRHSWGATRVSLEPTLKCSACGARLFVVDHCSEILPRRPMTNEEVVSFIRENMDELTCTRCGSGGMQLVWVGTTR